MPKYIINQFIPSTSIKDHKIVAAPFIAKGDIAFKGSTEVSLSTVDKNTAIYYSFGDDFKKYTQPIKVSEKGTLKVYAERYGQKSATVSTEFFKIDPNVKITLKNQYANQYNGGGKNALIDGIVGAEDFRTGTWQGYSNLDLVATVDLGKSKSISTVSIGFLEDQRSWIFVPTKVEVFISTDNKNFTKVAF